MVALTPRTASTGGGAVLSVRMRWECDERASEVGKGSETQLVMKESWQKSACLDFASFFGSNPSRQTCQIQVGSFPSANFFLPSPPYFELTSLKATTLTRSHIHRCSTHAGAHVSSSGEVLASPTRRAAREGAVRRVALDKTVILFSWKLRSGALSVEKRCSLFLFGPKDNHIKSCASSCLLYPFEGEDVRRAACGLPRCSRCARPPPPRATPPRPMTRRRWGRGRAEEEEEEAEDCTAEATRRCLKSSWIRRTNAKGQRRRRRRRRGPRRCSRGGGRTAVARSCPMSACESAWGAW
jgi:hypothetical protein